MPRLRAGAALLIAAVAGCVNGGVQPPSPLANKSDRPGGTVLFEGRVDAERTPALATLPPGVFSEIGAVTFSPDFEQRLRELEPEVLLMGTPDGRLVMTRRGWFQGPLVTRTAPDGGVLCEVFLDFRVGVREADLGKSGPFGRISTIARDITVLTPAEHGRCGLYVLALVTITVNAARIGEPFDEPPGGVADERRRDGKPTHVDAVPRWFVVEHELAHAAQILRALREAINVQINQDRLCNPDCPTRQHKARIEAAFDAEVQRLIATGSAGNEEDGPGYPNNDVEREARLAAWARWDAQAATTCRRAMTVTCTNGCPGGACCADSPAPSGWISCTRICERRTSWCP